MNGRACCAFTKCNVVRRNGATYTWEPRGVKTGRARPLSTRRRVGLVKTSTSSTTLNTRREGLRGSSVHRSGTLADPSPHESARSFQSGTSDSKSPTVPPSFTVPVDALTRDEFVYEEQVQSDGAPSSTGPHGQPETPSPTVSSFGCFSDPHSPQTTGHRTSRRLSERTRDSLIASITHLKNASKHTVVLPSKASRVFSHLKHSRKPSKASKAQSESAIQDTDSYVKDPDLDPFRTSASFPQDPGQSPVPVVVDPATEESKVATWGEEPTWGETSAWGDNPTTSPEDFTWGDYQTTARSSPTSSRAPTIRRSSLKYNISKLSHSLRQSSRVSFKRLSPISSSGPSSFVRPSQPTNGESLPPGPRTPSFASHRQSATDTLFPGSPEFPPPRPRTPSRQSTKAPSIYVTPAPLPPETTSGVVNPTELTPSPSIYPTEIDSPAQTTLPPPSRPTSWWFSPSQVFSPPPPPTSDPPRELQLESPTPKPRVSLPTIRSGASKSIPWKASTSQIGSLPSHRPSAPSAVPSHWSEHSASSAVPTPTHPASRSRAPTVGRSSESILFPQSGAPGEHQLVSQSSFQTRVPPVNPAHIPLPPSAFATPSPSIPSYSRRNSLAKGYPRSASRLNSRRNSRRTISRLPSIVSSGVSNPSIRSPTPVPAQTTAAEASNPQPSPPAQPTGAPPSPSHKSSPEQPSQPSPPPSRGPGTPKSRSRSGSRAPSAKSSFKSLFRLPVALVGSKQSLRSHRSRSSRQPSQHPSRASLRTHSDHTTPEQSPAPAPLSPPLSPQIPQSPPAESQAAPPSPQSPVEFHPPSHKSSFSPSRLVPSRKSSKHQFFTPSRRPSLHFAPQERATFPEALITSDGERIEIPAEIRARMPFNSNSASIDLGTEVEYDGTDWFSNPPPKPEPKAPDTVSPPYVPMPGVVEQNEAFIYALQAAPNVLYTKYKQYGQLGVLGWCAEFSELIEHLKVLGFEGNMFVNTRTQALATCQELLKLKLDIKMQIIIMYLSSQVARLRRFLDGEGEYDDYPDPTFPLETRTYT